VFNPRSYTEAFSRETGCTETEWLGWLPAACGGEGALQLGPAPGQARVQVGSGCLLLQWQTLPPRQIALAQLPRMQVDYRFDGVEEGTRQAFMKRFDLYMQRGGG
jgi:hypothetical protein